MNGFLFSGPTATRPAALSAAVAGGGNATKSRNLLAEKIADRIVADDVRRLKAKPAALLTVAQLVDDLHRGQDEISLIIERFRAGGAK